MMETGAWGRGILEWVCVVYGNHALGFKSFIKHFYLPAVFVVGTYVLNS